MSQKHLKQSRAATATMHRQAGWRYKAQQDCFSAARLQKAKKQEPKQIQEEK